MLQNQEKNVCYKGNDGLLCYNTNNRKYVIKEMTISYVTKPKKNYAIKEMAISYVTIPRIESML